MKISRRTAKDLMLYAQGLLNPRRENATKKDVLVSVHNMGHLQIDTINIVNRSPYLVLWSRLGAFDLNWLSELLEEKKIFEYWSHAMCFLPIEDYPLYRRLMLDYKGHWNKKTEEWINGNKSIVESVLLRIKEKGETRSSDFKRTNGQKGGWWNWKIEKTALEVLFDKGDLMIARRHNFHRHYDLRETILPLWKDLDAPTYEEVQKSLAIKAVKALGVATPDWISDYFYTPKREIQEVLNKLLDIGEILPVEIEDLGKAYIPKANLKIVDALEKPILTTLLSPFDPLINNRKRVLEVFNFNYRIECYTPAPKRIYGYFTLPILYKGNLVGRIDPKAHRKDGIFEVKSLHLEKDVRVDDEMIASIAKTLDDFANWHETPEVVVRKSNPKNVARLLMKFLKN